MLHITFTVFQPNSVSATYYSWIFPQHVSNVTKLETLTAAMNAHRKVGHSESYKYINEIRRKTFIINVIQCQSCGELMTNSLPDNISYFDCWQHNTKFEQMKSAIDLIEP